MVIHPNKPIHNLFCLANNIEPTLKRTLESVLAYLQKNNAEFDIESIGSVVLSCPLTLKELIVGKRIHQLGSVCVSVTDLIINVSQVFNCLLYI